MPFKNGVGLYVTTQDVMGAVGITNRHYCPVGGSIDTGPIGRSGALVSRELGVPN